MDLKNLQERLEALGDPTRFKLLGLLNEPRTVNEIQLETKRGTPKHQEDRSMTRQGVRYHLTKLEKAGLIQKGTTTIEGRQVTTYQASPRGLFAMIEQLHAASRTLAQGYPPAKAPNFPDLPPLHGPWGPEPRLVQIHGLNQGKAYPLTGKDPNADQGWVLGTDPNADIHIPWDPIIEGKAAELIPTTEGINVLDYRSTDHRVTVNDEPMTRGAETRLQRGDLIQVGFTLLLYHGP